MALPLLGQVIYGAGVGAGLGGALFGTVVAWQSHKSYLQNQTDIYQAYADAIGKTPATLTQGEKAWAFDVYRHMYVSGKMAKGMGEVAAQAFDLNELNPKDWFKTNESNMDYWNNALARDLGVSATDDADLIDKILDAIENEDAILHPTDTRLYPDDFTGALSPISKDDVLDGAAIYLEDAFDLNIDMVDPDQLSDGSWIISPKGNDNDAETTDSYAEDVQDQFDNSEDQSSPLILDLDGDGIELTSLNSAYAVYWDIDVDGFAEASGWVGADDGILAIDLNDDGIINNSSELFGDQTGFSNGFLALAAHDSNNDGIITSLDAVWSDLLVWQDTNGDGYSQDAELQSLDAHLITEIDTGYSDVIATIAGNAIKQESTFVINGSTNDIVDAYLTHSNINTRYAGEISYDLRANFLSNLRGYGSIYDLVFAISEDNSGTGNIFDQLKSFDSLTLGQIFTDDTSALDDVRDIMFRWAGVDGVSSTSRGENIDARELEFLEKFNGKDFLQQDWNSDPYYFAGQALQEGFDIALQNIAARLIAQSAGAELFTGDFYYDVASDSFSGITGLDLTTLSTLETMGSSATNKEVFWGNVVRVIEHTVGTENLSGGDETALDTAINNTDGSLDLDTVLAAIAWQGATGSDIDGDNSANTLNGGVGDDYIDAQGDADTVSGGDGADTIFGGAGDDILSGEGDDDLIYGNFGADTYHYNLGDGVDVYGEESTDTDTIEFGAGITLGDLTITLAGSYDLLIEIDTGSQTGTIVIENQYNYAAGGGSIETLRFADTSTYTLTDKNFTLNGTDFDDTLYGAASGGHGEDTIYGGDGDDTIYAFGPNETDTEDNFLYGEDGNDMLFGSAGDDTLDGGAGNDVLDGAGGDDIYFYSEGDDVFSDYLGTDEIQLASGITSGDITYTRFNSDLALTIAGAGSILIEDFYSSSYYQIETLRYYDTTTTDLTSITVENLYGTNSADSLYGLAGVDENIFGLGGNDYLYGYSGNDVLDGGTGDDYIYGYAGNDVLIGGAGDDYLEDSTSGDDVYVYSSGLDDIYDYDGSDTLRIEGYGVNDITFTDLGDNHELVFDSGVDELEIQYVDYYSYYEIERIEFEDGFFSDQLADMENWTWGTASGETLNGDTSANVLIGRDGDDTLNGDSGSDDLHGGAGADTLNGGNGDDVLFGGDGDDTIYGNSNHDILNGGKGSDELWGGSGGDTFLFDAISAFTASDDIKDFNLAHTDKIDVSDLLEGYDPLSDLITDFVEITDDGTHSFLKVDADGGADNFVQIAQISNKTGLTDEDALETSGALIAA